MSESKSLFLAAFLSAVVVIAWQFFFHSPAQQTKNTYSNNQEKERGDLPVEISQQVNNRSGILVQTQGNRVKIDTNNLHGSINTKGARIDDITLAQYKVRNTPESDEVVLFSPSGSKESYFAEFGWVSRDGDVRLPNADTVWKVDNNSTLSQDNDDVLLAWDNGSGLVFKINIRADDHYLLHITQYVTNNTDHTIKVIPYGRLNRAYPNKGSFSLIFHEGPIGKFDERLEELSYSKIQQQRFAYTFNKGWFGFSDKYWFASIVPFSNKPINAHIKYTNNKYQLDFTQQELVVEPNTTVDTLSYLFAGAKNLNVLDDYSRTLNIRSFDRVVDFGILYFITKPIFLLLQYINSWIGNFGLAILLLTVLVRLLLLPISMKATISMLKMRQIKPELQRLKSLHATDKIKLNQEVMALFKKHNVSPMAGLLPSILQIPIFFSLYKVLSITIEMRHAPFYGWIKDLSAKDPTNIFTLFGLLDWSPPALLSIGILPIALGATMFLQQKINAPYKSYDSAQADFIKMMPYIFTFLFANFPTGLILYWLWNNLLSILQQLVITKIKFQEKK